MMLQTHYRQIQKAPDIFRKHSVGSKHSQEAPDTFKMLQTHSGWIQKVLKHSRCSRHIQDAPDTFGTDSKGPETFKMLHTHSSHIQWAPDTFGQLLRYSGQIQNAPYTFMTLQTHSGQVISHIANSSIVFSNFQKRDIVNLHCMIVASLKLHWIAIYN